MTGCSRNFSGPPATLLSEELAGMRQKAPVKLHTGSNLRLMNFGLMEQEQPEMEQ
jgi:hypothetical protein